MHDFEEGRTHRGVTGPMNFKKMRTFFFVRNSCSRDFGAPDCYPSTLIDLANFALASRDSAETICKICEGCRTHRGVTGPMNFTSRTFFFMENRAPGFLGHLAAIKALYLTLQTRLWLVASRVCREPICTI